MDNGRKVLKLMESLDDHDDVQNVSANFNIPDAAMAELAADIGPGLAKATLAGEVDGRLRRPFTSRSQ